jgi:hypothetical protein
MAFAAPAFAATSAVTQADCNSGNITRHGRTLSKSECEALIGQRVNLASTGFEAWMVGAGGVALLGVAVALRMRRRGPGAQLA